MRLFRKLLLAVLATLLAPAIALAAPHAPADPPRRVLHVSLYPYIPDAAAAALTLKQGFERTHPGVIVEITFNPNYYSLDPADKGVLYEEADVHEIDVIFLKDMLAKGRLAPLPAAFLASLEPSEPMAVKAATVDGRMVAVPQWMCADFLIYRADITGLDSARTLGDVETALAHDGLLADLSGDALGELYLSILAGRSATPGDVLSEAKSPPDAEMVARLKRMLALVPPGLGRTDAYKGVESFYARQFARREGGAVVGYSEMMYEVLDETAKACRLEARCVTAPELRVTSIPFADNRVRPMVWSDMFAIDAHVHGRKFTDAEDFIRYAVSMPAFRALLIPAQGQPPRYLLPAADAAFSDPAILKNAPLYPRLKSIVDQGEVVTALGLSTQMHDVAMRIDADLPKTH